MIRTLLGGRIKRQQPYILIIGFNKSGTTSIHKLFEDNGIPSIHWDNGNLAKRCLLNAIHGRPTLHGYDKRYNVFSDFLFRNGSFWLEGNSLFRQMHESYPDAYFIYNKRNIEDWVKSRINHPTRVEGLNLLELQKKILKTNHDSDAIDFWIRKRTAYEMEIRKHFSGSKRFLEVDIYNPEAPILISEKVSIPLDPTFWKQHNQNTSLP